jgi:hypothetical protein
MRDVPCQLTQPRPGRNGGAAESDWNMIARRGQRLTQKPQELGAAEAAHTGTKNLINGAIFVVRVAAKAAML